MSKYLSCPSCGYPNTRAYAEYSVAVGVLKDGTIIEKGEASAPEVNTDRLFCGTCGYDLRLIDHALVRSETVFNRPLTAKA